MKGTVILLCIAVAALGIAQLITNRQINTLQEDFEKAKDERERV